MWCIMYSGGEVAHEYKIEYARRSLKPYIVCVWK